MKNTILLGLYTLLTFLPIHAQTTNLETSQKLQECLEQPIADNAISYRIGITYLRETAKLIKKLWKLDKQSFREKIFERIENDTPVNFHSNNVCISCYKEQYLDCDLIVIQTNLIGSVEDFEYKNILEHEKNSLKYTLIQKYLDSVAANPNTISVLIDNQTKVIQPPMFAMEKTNGFPFNYEVRSDKYKGMILLTYFTSQEFDALIETIGNELFPKKEVKQEIIEEPKTEAPKRGWLW